MSLAALQQNLNNSFAITRPQWLPICQRSDLVTNSGVCALWGDTSVYSTETLKTVTKTVDQRSVALFFLPEQEQQLYAVDNWDPIAQAGVIARGIIAEMEGELTIASPLYKHHFRLSDGVCMEDSSIRLATYPLAFNGDMVYIGSNKIQ
ncbi:nitrite reductase small subunit NirD [Microbulbifer sp. OS29]|uniref:Nitrite reductase small subunit NirD n=1 Tax=Microbulbifer okhotskensis TaxID=2926617 RepID=A0A9X2J5U6_9GAMM|nr:nitrite reductase small subunit NirD [Microbulbifer okhotskensis]MCO1335922.1 nitrite reductase small subunit NirD [Microbulbifer okhotskensis]